MSDDLNTEIKIGADASGVEAGVGRAKRSLASLGDAAGRAGRDGGKGLEQIGDGGDAAAKKVESATRSMQNSLQRLIAEQKAGEKGSRAYYEALADTKGVSRNSLKPLLDELDAAKRKTEDAKNAAVDWRESLAGIGGAAIGAAIGATAVGIAAMVRQTIDAADSFSKLSAKSGVAVESLRELNYAASLSDVSTESLSTGLRKLSQNMAAAAGGSELQAAAFDAIGISVKNADGSLKGADQALKEIASKFSTFKDGPEKAALAIELFGKQGADLIPLLNGGAAGLSDMADEANRLGIVFDGGFAKNAEAFNDNLTRIQTGVQGAAVAITKELLPTLNTLAQSFVDAQGNSQSFATWLGNGLRVVTEAATILIADVSFTLKGFGREIAAIGAQFAALGRGDLTGFSAISDAVKEDGVRAKAELDKFTFDLLNARYLTSKAGGGRGTAPDPRSLGIAEDFSAPIVKQSEAATKAIKTVLSEYDKLVQKLGTEVTKAAADAEGAQNGYNKAQSEFVALARSPAWAKFTNEQRATVAALYEQKIGSELATDGVKSLAKAQEDATKKQQEYVKEQLKGIAAAEKSAQSAGATLQKYQDEEQTLTLAAAKNISLAQAIAEVELARLREAQTTAIASNANQGVLLALDEEIKKREQIVQAIGRKESREAVDKSAKEAAADWKKAAEQIEQSITDALFRGFESGKGFGENLRDTLENTFKTLVLRPIIQGTVRGVLGGSQGVDGLDPSNPFSGIASIAKSFESIGPALTDFKLFATNGAYDLGGSLTNAGFDKAGSLVTKNASQIGSLANTVGRTLGYLEAASNFKDGSYGKSIGQAAGTAFFGPIGGQIGKELGSVVDRLFSKGEYVQSTGDANAVFNSTGQAVSRNNFAGANSNAISNKAADDFINGLQKSYADATKRLGIGAVTSSFVFGSNNSDGGKFALGGGAGSSNFRQEEIKATPEAIQLASSRAIFAALQGSELPGYLSKVFDGITASTAAQADIDAALGYATSLKTIRDALTETRTPLQILKDTVAEAFTALGTTADSFKTDFVAAIDGGIAPEKLAQYLALGQNLDALAQASGTASTAVTEVTRSLTDIANERKSLDERFAQATLNTAQLAARARDAIDASNKSRFDEVIAAEAAKTAADALAESQASLAESAKAAADQLKATNDSLQDRLDVLTGAQTDRSLQLRDATDESTKALLRQIFAQEDYAAATAQTAETLRSAIANAQSVQASAIQRYTAPLTGGTAGALLGPEVSANFAGKSSFEIREMARTYVASLDAQTEAGRAAIEQFNNLVPAIEYFANAADASAAAAAKGVEDAARAADKAQEDAIRASEAAASAAKQVRDAWQSVTDSLFDEVRRIRGLNGGNAQTFAGAQAQFSITAAQASAGDQAAAKALPELSKVLLSLAETQATSLLQLRVIQGQTAGALEAVGGSLASQYGLTLPKLATGTNYIPKDGPYYLHEGESVVPVAYNPSSGGQNNDALIAEMQAMRGMLAALQAAADKTATATTNSDKTLTRVTRGGDNMITKDYTVQ